MSPVKWILSAEQQQKCFWSSTDFSLHFEKYMVLPYLFQAPRSQKMYIKIFGPGERALIRGGSLSKAGCLLDFHHFQQYSMFTLQQNMHNKRK